MLIGVLLLGAWWLGAKRVSVEKQGPYESGVVPESSARLAWPVPFYLVAIFFIIFDVEAAFIFAWAVAWEPLGLTGLVQITVFITILCRRSGLALAEGWPRLGTFRFTEA